MSTPKKVKLVEVGPRDGLQNEAQAVTTATKIDFINRLSATGLQSIEVTSFVSPKWIPQLADHAEVFSKIDKKPGVTYSAFVPNLKGLERAIAAGVKNIAVFSTPSEQFSQRNVNCTVHDNLLQIAEMLNMAKAHNVNVRGYISCVLGCPYEGGVDPAKVAELAEKLIAMGCDEISLGDTIGVGTPLKTQHMLTKVLAKIAKEKVAVHFHDTYGQALVNIYAALLCGIAIIDCSVGGLGGCPYARGASGNVATEDVLYMLDEMGIETGVNLKKLVLVSNFIVATCLKKYPVSKLSQVYRASSL